MRPALGWKSILQPQENHAPGLQGRNPLDRASGMARLVDVRQDHIAVFCQTDHLRRMAFRPQGPTIALA